VRLPEDAVARFSRARPASTATEQFEKWNRAWVDACISYGPIAVRLRSSEGFLSRRKGGDSAVAYVCSVVEPLLLPLAKERLIEALWIWNALSDPREVLDQHQTRRRSARSIAHTITQATIAAVTTHA
jgi:hypothetical protein